MAKKIHATQDWVKTEIANLTDSAPETLDTLGELAKALGNDENFAATIVGNLANKVDKVEDKGLSTNDYTDADKNKLDGLENYELPSDVVKDAKYVHTDNNYTTEEREKLADLKNYDDTKLKDELNLKLYGTTDVYTLTKDDINIVDGHFKSQKFEKIEHDIIIIPEGVTEIRPEPLNNDNYEEGEFIINLIAKKVICPDTLRTLKSIRIPLESEPEVIYLGNETLLNEGLETITLEEDANGGSIGDLVLPSTVLNFDTYMLSDTIILPEFITSIKSFSIFFPDGGKLYVYNPTMDFSSVIYLQDDYSPLRGLTIYGYLGSTAYNFAKENNIKFIDINDKYSIIVNHSNANTTSIRPNEYYTFSGVFDETGNEVTPLSSLTVTLDTVSTTKLDEFMFSFITPSDISAFSFEVLTDESVEVKWIKEPNLKPNYIYEVSVVNGVGVIAGTAKEVA